MSEITTPCGSECTRYLLEGNYGCDECMRQFEEDELKSEMEFFRDYDEVEQ